jgi:histidine phosphotransferase ChpT
MKIALILRSDSGRHGYNDKFRPIRANSVAFYACIPGMKTAMHFAELLATRICHDLSGPLNTLMAALEIATEDPDGAADALPVAGDAAVVLGQRLRLLRAAWGGGGGAMAIDEIATLAAGLPGRNLQLDLGELHAERLLSAPAARLVLNALMLAAEALPTGGVIQLSGDTERQVMLQITGGNAAWPTGFIGYLADPLAAERALGAIGGATARGVQGPLLAVLARGLGLRVSVLLGTAAESAPPLLLDLQPPR